MYMSKLTEQVSFCVAGTKRGKLRGVCKEGGYIFRGVKYGKAERFQMAKPVEPWEGVRDAVAYGYTAPELHPAVAGDQFQQQHFYTPQNEDCQYLNIWTQHIDPAAKRPVIVLFHGGGWDSGSSVEQFAYDGENMSRFGDVVFVSVEHRLNCLGSLYLSEFGEKYRDSNYAALGDAILALEWIQENIEAFGGDPGNVTLIGHAGGGPQVMTLLNSPMADGLYHKAALGGNVVERFLSPKGISAKEAAVRAAKLTVQNLGLTADTLEEIEQIPCAFLMEAALSAQKQVQEETGTRFRFDPLADGVHLVEYSLENPLPRRNTEIPLLTGGDFGDASSNFRNPIDDNQKDQWSMEKTRRLLYEMYGESANCLLEEFEKAYPEKNPADLLFIDRKARHKNLQVGRSHAAAGGKVWNWVFALNLPLDGSSVPWHCCDTAYITHNAQYMEASYIPGVSDRIQDLLCGAYVAFAANGDPNGPGLPEWNSFMRDSVTTMIFDEKIRAATDHDRKLQEFMKPWQK